MYNPLPNPHSLKAYLDIVLRAELESITRYISTLSQQHQKTKLGRPLVLILISSTWPYRHLEFRGSLYGI